MAIILKWMKFPVNNTIDNGHSVNTKKGRTYIDSNNTSLVELLEMLPDLRRNAEDNTHLSKEKVIDPDHAFDASNVR